MAVAAPTRARPRALALRRWSGSAGNAALRLHAPALGVVALVSAVSVWLRHGVPITVATESIYDDVLYVRQAHYLIQGRWLGPFDTFTLSKSPGYPIFMAATHSLGFSVKVGEQVTVLLAAAVTAACAWVLLRRAWAATLVYAVVALMPDNFSVVSAQLLRDSWYAPLTLLFVSASFLTAYLALTKARLVWTVPVALLAGYTGAGVWLTREEGPWIAPAVAVAVGGLGLLVLAARRRELRTETPGRAVVWRRAGRLAVALALLAGAFWAPVNSVLSRNTAHYGVAVTNDVGSGNLVRVLADWSRVEAGPRPPQVPLSRAQRAAVYRVSPAAAELRPALESPASPWMVYSCGGVVTARCDLNGAFVIWAVRDATLGAGRFRSEPSAQRYFGTLDAQILAACSSGRLHCAPRLPAALQSLQHVDVGQLLRALRSSSTELLWSTRFTDLPSTATVASEPLRRQSAAVTADIAPTQARAEAQMRQFRAHAWRYRLLAATYRLALPVLCLLALIGTVLGLSRRATRRTNALSVLCVALVVAAVSRLGLLAVLSATSFDADLIRYELVARLLLAAFAVLGTAQLADQLHARRAARRAAGEHRDADQAAAGADPRDPEPEAGATRPPLGTRV